MTTKTAGALEGLRVIDLSRVLGGPWCTQVLGDHGADVIKIEPPQGDETRGWGPPFVEGTAAYYLGTNRNKRGMVVDFGSEAGRELLLRLLEDADVLVENFKTGTLERWGLGFDEVLSRRFPRLVHCRISGFGADGPLGGLPGYDAAIQAMAGLMSVNGEADRGPLRVGLPIVDMVTGLNAVTGILLALHERGRSGRGQFVEATLWDSGLSLLHPHMANHFASGRLPKRTGNAHPNISPYDSFPAADGQIYLAVGNDRQFATLCAELGRPDLAADPRFAGNGRRCENRAALRGELEAALAGHAREALADRLIRAGVPCAPVFEIDRAVAHPHTRHRGMIVEMGAYRGIGAPAKLGRTPATYRRAPPARGADTAAVLGEHGYGADEIARLVAAKVVAAAEPSGEET